MSRSPEQFNPNPEASELKKPYDWKQGRPIIEDENAYFTGQVVLEQTENEKLLWKQIDERVKQRESDYGQQGFGGFRKSLARLNDPVLGPLIIIWNLKKYELEDRHDIFSFDSFERKMKKQKEGKLERTEKKRRGGYNRKIADKVLAGQELSLQDFTVEKYKDLKHKESKIYSINDIAGDLWHFVIQLPDSESYLRGLLPYTVDVSREEATQAIDAFFQDIERHGGKYELHKNLQQEAQESKL